MGWIRQRTERAGNSAEVLLSRCAKCIERQETAGRKAEELLRGYE
ncbi:hypothetical protein ACVV2G_04200 [Streptomyces ziwulingensis]